MERMSERVLRRAGRQDRHVIVHSGVTDWTNLRCTISDDALFGPLLGAFSFRSSGYSSSGGPLDESKTTADVCLRTGLAFEDRLQTAVRLRLKRALHTSSLFKLFHILVNFDHLHF